MTLRARLEARPYESYGYSYPHKLAYETLWPRVTLERIWGAEDRGSLFLYVHVPFCEMRCGFCNLMALAHGSPELVEGYLDALERQVRCTAETLGNWRFARLAIGGGTPTALEAHQLERLFEALDTLLSPGPVGIPASCETSPATATADRLRVLAGRGVSRVSIGIQSFDEEETRALGRAQRAGDGQRALACIRAESFRILNVDLMYGIPGQTETSLFRSLKEALAWHPEEIYLYPLYVRPLTGLGRTELRPEDPSRRRLYRAARDLLLKEGYRQVSMRMFRRRHLRDEGPPYSCQRDGMVGMGPGARSYTTPLHYSSEWAVLRPDIRAIIEDYASRSAEDFRYAYHGFWLTPEELRRRYVIQSLLSEDGLEEMPYQGRFHVSFWQHFPELAELADEGLAVRQPGRLRLTTAGLELSDAIAPWLHSDRVRRSLRSLQP